MKEKEQKLEALQIKVSELKRSGQSQETPVKLQVSDPSVTEGSVVPDLVSQPHV